MRCREIEIRSLRQLFHLPHNCGAIARSKARIDHQRSPAAHHDGADDGRPVDALHIHGYAPREDSRIVEKAIWEQLSFGHAVAPPDTLGEYAPGKRSEALAIAQLLLLWHLLEARA